MPDVNRLREVRKKAEDALKALETKKLKGEIPDSEYEAWKRELTKNLEKIDSALEGKSKPKVEEEDKSIDSKLKAYPKSQVETVLKGLLDGSVESITPVLDWKSGSRYPRVEKDASLSTEESKALLEKLCESGGLRRELNDVFIKCPKCSSFSVRSRLSCPSCGSSDIVNGLVIGHFKCGYADFVDRFKREKETYVCPKCKAELRKEGVDYQRPGVWFKCQNCGKFFPTAIMKQSCNDCGALFENEESVLYRAPSYKLSSQLEKGIVSGLLVAPPVKEDLAKVGLKLESPFVSTGNSGEKQQFMMGITDTNAPQVKPIVVDIVASDGKVDLKEVVTFFAKACDVDASAEILVGLPSFSDEAKKAASSYGVLTVEATERKQIPSAFIKMIESLTKTNVEEVKKEIAAIKSALGV
jgi:Zn finger protein HypA/HybF involved in hydrogenase expression